MSSMTGEGSRRGKQPGRPAGQRKTGKTQTNAPLIDPNGKRAKSKKPSNNHTEVKRKKKKQKAASAGLPSLPESITNTLPSLCKIFKKPQRQQGTSTPSREFRKHYMCQTWDDNYVQISPLHDIMEEEEEEEEDDEF
ncbi:hypothetical protein AWC38_SpisGene20926 [Stylophora pistillata]|uniref:Uncharacterized protein n=2 Tax=Stylophora pistillata TaxID=50429 RepID=A0A2B4R960_STYPI|nr:hypothetical protein AWC38_SpisGene20926 [Stylophora pistillata]